MPTTNNTAYNVRTDVVTSESGLTIEEGALYTYDGELKAHLGGSTVVVKPKTTIVNISSAQILAMGTTPIELLPAAGANKYYDVEKIILEYNAGTAYDFSTDFPYISMGNIQKKINPLLFFDVLDYVGIVNALDTAVDVSNEVDIMGVMILNENLKITTWNGTDPTLGDGTLRAIITYTTRTFGA